jgi:hypothetical protein
MAYIFAQSSITMKYRKIPETLGAIRAMERDGAKLRPAADESIMKMIMETNDIVLPEEIQCLYHECNGSEGEFGEWMWKFWSIDSDKIILGNYLGPNHSFVLQESHRIFNPLKYLIILDSMIDLPIYAYCADSTSQNFGEVIGCHIDRGFVGYCVGKTTSRFFQRFIDEHITHGWFEPED